MHVLILSALCILFFVAIVIFITIGFHKKWLPWSIPLVWPSMLAIGLTTAACMAVLCVIFTCTLILDTTKHANAATEPNASTSAKSAQNLPPKKPEGKPLATPNDTTIAVMPPSPTVPPGLSGVKPEASTTPEKPANQQPASPYETIPPTMSAVALAMTTIALVITVGTSWVASKMKELDAATKQYEKIGKDTEEVQKQLKKVQDDYAKAAKDIERDMGELGQLTKDLRKETEQIMKGRSLLLGATIELHERLKEKGGTINPLLIYQEAQLYLKLLMDKSPSIRKDAFDYLRHYLLPNHYIVSHKKYQCLQAYFEYCSNLHDDGGKYCRIFSEDEGDIPDRGDDYS